MRVLYFLSLSFRITQRWVRGCWHSSQACNADVTCTKCGPITTFDFNMSIWHIARSKKTAYKKGFCGGQTSIVALSSPSPIPLAYSIKLRIECHRHVRACARALTSFSMATSRISLLRVCRRKRVRSCACKQHGRNAVWNVPLY